ncbi:Rv0361 family membrane protein [Mycolicibacterium llatzerense]
MTCCSAQPAPTEAITRAVENFSAVINKSDFVAARKLACGRMLADLSTSDTALLNGRSAAGLMVLRTTLTNVATPRVDGGHASVPVTVRYTSSLPQAAELTRGYDIELQKVDSGWKICSFMPAEHP